MAPVFQGALVLAFAVFTQIDDVVGAECDKSDFPELEAWFEDGGRDDVLAILAMEDQQSQVDLLAAKVLEQTCKWAAGWKAAAAAAAESDCEMDAATKALIEGFDANMACETCVCPYASFLPEGAVPEAATTKEGDPICEVFACFKEKDVCAGKVAEVEDDSEWSGAMNRCHPPAVAGASADSAFGPSSTWMTASFATLMAMGCAHLSM